MRRLPAAVAALALLLAGCGAGAGGTDDADADGVAPGRRTADPAALGQVPAPAPTGAADPLATADPRGALADLAALAERAAGTAAPAPLVPGRAGALVRGADISWPQCPVGLGIPEKRTLGLPPPLPEARFVVIGLTNGPGFTTNPCLADQVALARGRGLLTAAYAVLSYPDAATVERWGPAGPHDPATPAGLLRNVGWQQARHSAAAMRAAGLETPAVWLDVEPVPSFGWSTDPQANAAVVEGAARGWREAGYRVGVYSTPALWRGIVGDLRLGVPEWRPAGASSQQAALARCGADWAVQGGTAVMAQWVADQRDHDVTCPGMPGELSDWFHTW